MNAAIEPVIGARCRRVVLALLACMLAGCASAPLIRPLAPGTLGQRVEQRQQISIDYRGQRHSLQVALKVAPRDLTLIGLSPIGQRLFTLTWDGSTATVTSALEGAKHLPAKRILADMQLAYWPLPVLRQALADPALRLEQRGPLRTLWRGDQLLWMAYCHDHGQHDDACRWHSAMSIYDSRGPYRLEVQPLALDGSAG